MIKIFAAIIFISLFFFNKEIYSQNKITIDSIDAAMEEYQSDNNWDRMISLGESSLRKGFDSFFLRGRLGIAYFETGNYLKAITQLEFALNTGIDNPSVLKNLYYCYFYTGREADRNFVFSKLSEKNKKSLQPLNNLFVNNIYSDFGFSFSSDKEDDPVTVNTGAGDLYNEQTVNGNAFNIGVGINQLLFKSLSIDYYYDYIKLDKTKIIRTSAEQFTNSYSEYQNRFFNKYNIRVYDGLIFSPAGHYISTKYSTIYGQTDTSNSGTVNSGSQNITVTQEETFDDSFVLSADISKYFTSYKAGVNGSFSYLNNIHQWQLGASFKIFPLGRATFYSASDIYIQDQNDVSNLIFNQSFGGLYKKKFFYELFFTLGNLNNFNEKNGAVVYNNPDIIKFKAGFDLKYYVTDLFGIFLGYGFQSRERNIYSYTNNSLSSNAAPVSQKSSLITYSINNIYSGFKFTF